MTTSRRNLFQFTINQGQNQGRKRKREAGQPKPGASTDGGPPDVQTEKVAAEESGARVTERKRRKVGPWNVTEQDRDSAAERVTDYKSANVTRGTKAADRMEGVQGGPATGWRLGDLQVSIERSYQGQRVNQILVELSTALFEKAKAVQDEHEVECLYIGSDQLLLISSNVPGSAGTLRDSILNFTGLSYVDRKGLHAGEKILTKNAIDKLLQEDRPQRKIMENVRLLNSYLAQNPSIYRGKSEAEAVQALLGDSYTGPYIQDIYSWLEYKEIAERLRKLEAKQVMVAEPAAAADTLAGMEKGVIIVKNTFQPLHAELTLLYTYIKSGRSDTAYVYGRKRPCQGCYLTLAYAKGLGYSLEYNPHPGNWFEGNVAAAIAYYGGLNSPEELTTLHKNFKILDKDQQRKIMENYALIKDGAYATMVNVTGKKKPQQEARGMSTPPNSPVRDSGDPGEAELRRQYNELMEMDEDKKEGKMEMDGEQAT
jgi:hypothetical protein